MLYTFFQVINAKDAYGQTPLMLAMANGHLDTGKMPHYQTFCLPQ